MRMTWDEVGQRIYAGGIDRCVLYLPDGTGVPWNGLTGVDQDKEIESESFYFEGIKYLDSKTSGDYSASLKAFTYPDEFLPFDGYASHDYGILLDNQPVEDYFGLSYRTLVGNDVDGSDYGYQIHLIWNLTAVPDSRSYSTFSEEINPSDFGWKITAVPEVAPGYRPTAHMIIDTTKVNKYLVADLEALLYGVNPDEIVEHPDVDGGTTHPGNEVFLDGGSSAGSGLGTTDGGTPQSSGDDSVDAPSMDPVDSDILDGGSVLSAGLDAIDGGDFRPSLNAGLNGFLPSLSTLLAMISDWAYITIVDNGDGTWTATDIDELGLIRMVDETEFIIDRVAATYLDDDTFVAETTHAFLGG